MRDKPTLKRALSDAIYSAHRLQDMSKSKTRRFRKSEMNDHLRNINILRQEYGDKFSTAEQKIINDYVPSIHNRINKGQYEAVGVFAEGLLDVLTTKTVVSKARPQPSQLPRKRMPRITPKTPRLRR